jgi:flagellar hook protein FlgE
VPAQAGAARAPTSPGVNLSSLSGMQAASLLVDAIGHNVANVDTAGFHAQGVGQATTASGGVAASVTTAAGEGVDLAEQVARLISASIAYDANARVAQTQDEVARSAVDVLA